MANRKNGASAAALACLAVAACSGGGDDPGAADSPAPSVGGDPEQTDADRLVQELLEDEQAPSALATVQGDLPLLDGSSPVEVEVLMVRAGTDSPRCCGGGCAAAGQPVRT